MTRSGSLLFLFSLILLSSLGLYRTSDRVQELDRQLRGVNAAIEGERENLHVLKAEWVYLANPARIEAAAKKHLALRPTVPHQIGGVADIAELLPARGETLAAAEPPKPAATIRSALASLPDRAAALIRHKPAAPQMASASGYLNDHISIQRTASSQPLPNSIQDMLESLNH